MTDQITTTSFVPSGTRVFLRRRFEEVAGFLLVVLSIAYLVALLTASRSDPSFNLATDAPVQNALGLPGAYIADLTLQSLGLASFMLVVALGVWGVRLMRHRPVGPWWLRLALLPSSLLAMAIGLGLVPWGGGWPFGVSLGGALGQLLFGGNVGGGGALTGLISLRQAPLWAVQLVCLLLALPGYYFALGISWRRYRQAGHAIASASGEVTSRTGAVIRFLRRRNEELAAEMRA